MTDQQLADVFTGGTAPERDPAFTLLVASRIEHARLRRRRLAFALRVTVLLVLSVPVFLASRLIEPMLAQLVEGWPRFMGVPVPAVLGVFVALVLRPRLYLLSVRLRAIFPVS